MKVKNAFPGWDFNTVWGIKEGETYPYFRTEDTYAVLNSISVSSGALLPAFDADVNNYEVYISGSAGNITISATAANPAVMISGTGTKTLNEGVNTFSITASDDEGGVNTYTITVHRPYTYSVPFMEDFETNRLRHMEFYQ
jgi:sortase (surface protein transpeptidase)